MPDYGVKTRSISGRVDDKMGATSWLVHLRLATIKSVKSLAQRDYDTQTSKHRVFTVRLASISDPALFCWEGRGQERREGGWKVGGHGVKILQRVFICSQHLLSDQYF